MFSVNTFEICKCRNSGRKLRKHIALTVLSSLWGSLRFFFGENLTRRQCQLHSQFPNNKVRIKYAFACFAEPFGKR